VPVGFLNDDATTRRVAKSYDSSLERHPAFNLTFQRVLLLNAILDRFLSHLFRKRTSALVAGFITSPFCPIVEWNMSC
jgi:hypothetical protein